MIKWKGYSVEDSTWEPENHLNCPAIIAKYNAKIAAQRIDDDTFSGKNESEEENDDVNSFNRKKSSSSKARASRIVSSPTRSLSKSPSKDPLHVFDPSLLKIYSKQGGISNFFKPTAATLPAPNSDDSVSYLIEC